MTCIIGVRTEHAVHIAADSYWSIGDLMVVTRDKINLLGKWWHSGDSYAVLDQLYSSHAEEAFDLEDATEVCEALRSLFADRKWGTRDEGDPVDSIGGSFVLARRGQLWHVDALLSAIRIPEEVPVACGCGADIAVSAYRAARLCEMPVSESVRIACQVACDLHPRCRSPVVSLAIGNDGKIDKVPME